MREGSSPSKSIIYKYKWLWNFVIKFYRLFCTLYEWASVTKRSISLVKKNSAVSDEVFVNIIIKRLNDLIYDWGMYLLDKPVIVEPKIRVSSKGIFKY